MSNCLIKEFRAQLTTTMDSLLKMAMSDIMKIYENTIHDHQLELAQKGEEIAYLKIKVQSAGVKLTESDQGAEVKTTQRSKPQIELKDVNAPGQTKPQIELKDVIAPGQTSNVPEIDFEVPDDWCAPLGCETLTKKQEDMCPSIRLRQLYIPLWRISLAKKAGKTGPNQRKGSRTSSRISMLKECDKTTQTSPVPDVFPRCEAARNGMIKLLQEIKQESPQLTDRRLSLRRRVRDSAGKEQKNSWKRKKKVGKITAEVSNKEPSSVKEQEPAKRFSCKLCKKGFNTSIGLDMHIKSHKKCRGCKKEFGHLSDLKFHRLSCAKHQKMSRKPKSSNPPKPQPEEKEKPPRPNKKQVTSTEESPPSSQSLSESSNPKTQLTRKYHCSYCGKGFDLRFRLVKHIRFHTGEKPFHCNLCPKKYNHNQSLRKHILKKHKGQVEPGKTNGSFDWTMPLEAVDDQEDLTLADNDTSSEMNHSKLGREINSNRKPGSKWQTMDTRSADGFTCSWCQKVFKDKIMLIEHFRIHTKDKPYVCDFCSRKFCFPKQLSNHQKKCGEIVVQCE